MKKLNLFISFLIFAALGICSKSLADPFDPGYIKSQHMQQFKIFERNAQLPAIIASQPSTKRFILKEINFEKNTAISKEELLTLVSSKLGKKVNYEDLSLMQNTICEAYKNLGYKSAIINVSAGKEPTSIIFSIYEGPKTTPIDDTNKNIEDQI